MSGSASTDLFKFFYVCVHFQKQQKNWYMMDIKAWGFETEVPPTCVHVTTKTRDEKGQAKMRKGSPYFHFLKWIKETRKGEGFFPLLVLFWLGHRNLAEVSWQHWLSESWRWKLLLWNWGRCRCWMILGCIKLVTVIHKDSQSPDTAC